MALLGVLFVNARKCEQEASNTREVAVVYALKARELQAEAFQVQQWLHDISATRAAEGYDDGFELSAEHAERFRKILDEFETLYRHRGDVEKQAFVAELRVTFDGYYKLGCEMAQAYIDGGPEKGNAKMTEFDPVSVSIHEDLHQLVDYHAQALETAMEKVIGLSRSNVCYALMFGSLGLVTAIVAGWLASRSVLRPLQQVISAMQQLAKGDVELKERPDDRRGDELGVLALAFNQFASTMQCMVMNITQQAHLLRCSSSDLAGVANNNALESSRLKSQSTDLAAAARQLESTMASTTSGTTALSDNSKSLAGSVTELKESISEIAKSAERAAGVADDTSRLTRSSSDQIRLLDQAAGRLVRSWK